MNPKTKDTIICSLIAALVIVAVILGGIYERGYYAVASELLLIPGLVVGIIWRRAEWE